MTLTKLLCEYMDVGDKGYVTLGDVVRVVVSTATTIILGAVAILTIAVLYASGAWLTYHGALTSGEELNLYDGVCVFWFVGSSLSFIDVLGIFVAHKLSSVRVATCERKDGDD